MSPATSSRLGASGDITKMLGGRFDWTWGQGGLPIEARRSSAEALVKAAMTEANYGGGLARAESALHACPEVGRRALCRRHLDRAEGRLRERQSGLPATLNWGEAKAPMLAYALIYAGTGLDNSANVLGPEVTRMVNEFTTKEMRQAQGRSAEQPCSELTEESEQCITAPHPISSPSAACSWPSCSIRRGVEKIFGYAGAQGYMEAAGVPGVLLPLVILTEAGGGLCVLLGLFTRWAAIALAGFCVLAAILFHWQSRRPRCR